jgi:ATP-dependent helicase HepA
MTNSQTRGLVLNGYVKVPGPERLGRLLAVNGNQAEVEITYSLVRRETRLYDARNLARAYLSPQTRTFLYEAKTDTYTAGRITDYDPALGRDGLIAYVVSLPNRAKDCLVESDLIVRSLVQVEDPTDALIAGGAESQFLFERRLGALRSLLEMRAGASGVESLVSASVELLEHQVEIVRRVLSDPVQRYLLADEVGLGKTIEACAILKAVLTEEGARKVVLMVPPSLVWQWQRELIEKFGLDPNEGRIDLVTPDELPRISAQAGQYSLLVVDEAHHVVGTSDIVLRQHLREAAHSIPRLLLLTATPSLGDSTAMLELLNLLDRVAYPLDDVSGFERKLQLRQQFGSVLLSLDAYAPLAILEPILDELLELTSNESATSAIIAQIRASNPTERDHLVRQVKAHVSETYRLHQRLLRTRRGDVNWPVRDCSVEVEEYADDTVRTYDEALNTWREAALHDDPQAAALYLTMVGALGVSPEDFTLLLEERAGDLERQVLAPAFDGEEAWLHDVLSQQRLGPTKLQQATQYVRSVARQSPGNAVTRHVIFTSSTALARALATQLERPGLRVGTILGDMTREEVDDQLESFVQSAYPAFLVCDAAGEEGLNLQIADGVIFLDLPFDLSRLEQRIGRLDRFGRLQPRIPLHIMLPSYYANEESPWSLWLLLLEEAFGLFKRSISDVQFLLEDLENQVREALYRNDAGGYEALNEDIKLRLEAERRRLDQQYALDQLNLQAPDTVQMYADLEAVEDREAELAAPLDELLFRTLNFDRFGEPDEGFVVRWADAARGWQTLLPREPWQHLYRPGLNRRVTHSRRVAVSRPAVQLIRPGNPLADVTEDLLRVDDRGTCYATLREEKRWPAENGIWLGLHLVYVIEPDAERLAQAIASSGGLLPYETLLRQARALLPSWIATLRVDGDLRLVSDPVVLELLERPYRGDRDTWDTNLASNAEMLAQIIGRAQFQQLCTHARQRSEELLRASPTFTREFEHTRLSVLQDVDERLQKLYRRAWAMATKGQSDPTQEQTVASVKALRAAIETPCVRLDAIGFEALSAPGVLH